jgi:hypothetical protein
MISEKNKLAGILTLAFILRVTGIGFGLPHLYHQDEPIIVNHALSIAAGGWNTHFFVIPPFTIYLFFLLQGIFFCLGKLSGVFGNSSDFALMFMRDPSFVYLLGRFFIGVVFGTATVWALWSGARRFFNEKVAMWAALFLAIMPVHVQHSHYIYADILLTLAVTLMFFALLRISESPTNGSYLTFGFLTGWAMSIKYTALYFVPVILVAHALAHRKDSFKISTILKLFLSAACCIAVFLFFAPLSLLDWKNFLGQLLRQSGAEGFVGVWHHAVYSIVGGSGMLFAAACVLGAVFLARSSRRKAAIAGCFVFIYYLINIYFTQRFARYMLPLMPILALLAGIGLERVRPPLRLILAGALCLELLLPTLYSDLLFLKKDTRTQCQEWLYKAVPAGSVVVVDNRFFAPHLPPSAEQVRQKYVDLGSSEKDKARKVRLDFMLQGLEGKKTYNVYQLADDEQQPAAFLFSKPFVNAEWDDLERIGTKYIIINHAAADQERKMQRFKQSISDRLELLQWFSPYRSSIKSLSVDSHDSTAAPHLPVEIFSRRRLGPYLEVYRIKDA